MAKPTTDTTQVCVRLSNILVAQLDELARVLSPAGVALGRTDALRAVIDRGLPQLQAEHGPTKRKR